MGAAHRAMAGGHADAARSIRINLVLIVGFLFVLMGISAAIQRVVGGADPSHRLHAEAQDDDLQSTSLNAPTSDRLSEIHPEHLEAGMIHTKQLETLQKSNTAVAAKRKSSDIKRPQAVADLESMAGNFAALGPHANAGKSAVAAAKPAAAKPVGAKAEAKTSGLAVTSKTAVAAAKKFGQLRKQFRTPP